MSSVGGDRAEQGAANRARLRDQLELARLARGYQVHGAHVELVRSPPPLHEPPQQQLARADGQATALPAVGAIVLAADCLPVALGAPGAVAMLHAGWRGLAAGVLGAGVRALRWLAAGTDETDAGVEALRRLDSDGIVAVLGPCAGPCCYEVGPEVHAALASGEDRKGPLDMRAIARRQLAALGVDAVSERGGCTICDERFFSHRREGVAAGRQAGVAWLNRPAGRDRMAEPTGSQAGASSWLS